MIKEKKEEKIIKLGLLFHLCNILGYLYELILTYIRTGKVFSHGLLFGPWLPIYGVGALLIMTIYKYRKKPFVIFGLSFLLTGILEYICGLFLLYVLKMRLWDYTKYFLNIDGLVCFASALCFGIGGLIITYLIYPLIKKIYEKIDKNKLKIFLIIISTIFLGDIIASIIK